MWNWCSKKVNFTWMCYKIMVFSWNVKMEKLLLFLTRKAFVWIIWHQNFELNLNSVVYKLDFPWLCATIFFSKKNNLKTLEGSSKSLLIYQITLIKQFFDVKCESIRNIKIKYPLGLFYMNGKVFSKTPFGFCLISKVF